MEVEAKLETLRVEMKALFRGYVDEKCRKGAAEGTEAEGEKG